MIKLKKIASAIAITFTLATASTAYALDEGKLLIWVNGDKGYNGIQAVGDAFTKETGIEVKVEHPENVTAKFQQAASAGKGPDIFIFAHDRIGEWNGSGLLASINPSKELKASISQKGWDAFTIGDKVFGYPISFEAVGLIYNKDLVSTPPTNFDEVRQLDKELMKQGKKAILWDYNNTYFTWGMLAAEGGYVFKKSDDGYDTTDIGVNSDGAITGAAALSQLIKDGVMPKNASYADMEAGVNQGKVAMMINGPWAWSNLEKSGINFGVAPIPAVKEQPGKPFIGVLGAMLNRASPNKELAVEFLENSLLTVDGLTTVDNDVALGTPANKAFFEKLSGNENIVATMKNVELGEPMPNVPEMGKFWSSMESALQNLTQGRQTAKEAMDQAAKRIGASPEKTAKK
ncbi:maltose/maltodextrin ABC transporter substrate-binding protein MalE [Leucothrix pacifica]|uniref:Maltodextrin-binding protein n=1 Tax=Leucothrix pacifica TaxID=1247513 RepID=A0A317CIP7_9GAMM|nr:maltose/maltodextrin ABC transporter substrate-binding protein MalE [Leucothrix pacifica]PWQ98061.1 maltose/maltodextrin ABC transporter substrate-binding protein MalE [Leucothrix pacifica]